MAVRQAELRKIYCFDEFQIDARKRVLLRDGKPVTLNSKAFDLLLVLATSGGRELSKDELMQSIWQDQIVEENNLAVHIYNLRKILGERKDEHRYIITVAGVGYRFVADVHEPASDSEELFIESRTVSRIVVEEETDKNENADEIKAVNGKAGYSTNRTEETITALSPFVRSRNRKSVLIAVGSVCVLLTAIFGYLFYRNRSQSSAALSPAPSQQMTLSRVTNNGQIRGAVISLDGKYVAYVLGESEGNSLWLRQTGTASDVRVLPPTKSEFWGLTFSTDGRFIYYNLFAGDSIDFELFRVPSLGGIAEKIPNVSSRTLTFSPDGKHLAYIESNSGAGFNSLVLADANGNNEQVLVGKEYPNTFYTEGPAVAWSPDGNTIACLVNQVEADANYFTIIGINPKDKTEKVLSERRWYDVSGIGWLNNKVLVISAKDKLSSRTQIWHLPYPKGEPQQITNDLNEYCELNATTDGNSLVAVQNNTVNGIFIGEINTTDFKEIVSEVGELNPLVWTPDGKIVFRSDKDGVSNLWMVDSDGNNRRQLTINAQVDFRGLCVSPDARYFVFTSQRSGKSNLWRVDREGNLVQLTDGEADGYPRCSPDGSSVIFQRGIYTKPTLWKVPLAGGAAEQLTEFRAKWAAISTDGKRISYFQMADGKWRIGIMPSDGTNLLQMLDAPADLKHSTVYWSHDNQALLYVGAAGNVGNIRSLPFNDAPSKPITNFTSHSLSDFSLSPDGKRLAVTRSISVSDVVLIGNTMSP